jgi:flagellar protein FliO/FliZ
MLDSLFGSQLSTTAKFVIAFVLVLGLIGITALILKSFGGSRMPSSGGGRNRQPRLSVLDSAVVDAKRRLVLIRRDNSEHLLLIGGPTDVVVETNINRTGAPQGTTRPQLRGGPVVDTDALESSLVPEAAYEEPIVRAPEPAPAPAPAPRAREPRPLPQPEPAPAPAPRVREPRQQPRVEIQEAPPAPVPAPAPRPEPAAFTPPPPLPPRIEPRPEPVAFTPPPPPRLEPRPETAAFAPPPPLPPRAEPRLEPRQEPRNEPRQEPRNEPRNEPAAFSPPPPLPPRPVAHPSAAANPQPAPLVPEPVAVPAPAPAIPDDEARFNEMAQRLEAALRKPATPPAPPRAPELRASAPAPRPAPAMPQTRPMPPAPAKQEPVNPFDSLEAEMASLLGQDKKR